MVARLVGAILWLAGSASGKLPSYHRLAQGATEPTIPFQYPLYKQCDPKWADDVMVTKTVCQVGCLMSSTSMALHGSGIVLGATGSTAEANPGTLNAWLKANGGYDDDNDLVEAVVPKVDPDRVAWPDDGMHKTNDLPFDTLKEYLQKPRVVIANVDKGHHFVLVTGWLEGDNDTVLVDDPGFPRTNYSYSKDVVGWRIFDMMRSSNASSDARNDEGHRLPLDTSFKLTHLDARCNDGTPAGIYTRPSLSTDAEHAPWVIYLEGGGWCYDEASCKKRWNNGNNTRMSSRLWEDEMVLEEGIFSQNCTKNPTFCSANHVYVRYCSSDGWSGAAPSSYLGYRFEGSRIVQSAVERLISKQPLNVPRLDPSNSPVLFTGCSAGGRGAMFNMDRVKQTLKKAKGFFDSGWWLEMEPIKDPHPPRYPSLVEQTQIGLKLFNATLDASCVEAYSKNDTWRCFLAPYAMRYVDTPSLSQAFQYDRFQLEKDTYGRISSNESRALAYAEKFRTTMRSTFENINGTGPGRGMYSPACYDHCSVQKDGFFRTSVGEGGPSLAEALIRFWSNESAVWEIDECSGFSCGVGC